MEKEPITKDGLDKLKKELENLKNIERPKIVEAISEARSHGDLKENAEYHAAKEQQAKIEGRVLSINDTIARANVIDVTKLDNNGKVIFGSTITVEDLENMKFHVNVPPAVRVTPQQSVDYFNSIVEGLSQFEPIHSKNSVAEDFTLIRGFDNILFQHGTLAWWAAVLSNATKVGVYGPWRPWKGSSNKNLSDINLEGWFKWS